MQFEKRNVKIPITIMQCNVPGGRHLYQSIVKLGGIVVHILCSINFKINKYLQERVLEGNVKNEDI